MSQARIYMDYNATAPLRPEAADAMAALFSHTGNASSVHGEGRAARARIEAARRQVARLAGADGHAVTFTSGGTEAVNLALTPHLRRQDAPPRRLRLLVGAGEHPCVLGGHRFAPDRVQAVPLLASGVLDLEALERAIAGLDEDEAPYVSLIAANNETGVVQPVREAADLAHARGGFLHTDAVQAAGKAALDMAALGADLMSLSAHKIGGPQGVGALIAARDIVIEAPLMRGGGQEQGLRAGTENGPGIAGFGAAAEACDLGWTGPCAQLRDRLEAGLRAIAPEVLIAGEGAPRLPNTSCFALAGLSAQTALIAFDLAGIAVSSGSACSSGKVSGSHVLKAMGLTPDVGESAIRVSLGWHSAEADIERVLQAWSEICTRSGAGVHAAA